MVGRKENGKKTKKEKICMNDQFEVKQAMLLNALADEDAKSAEDGEDNSHEKEEDNQQVSFSRNATV